MIKTENKVIYIAARKSKLLGLREMTGVCTHMWGFFRHAIPVWKNKSTDHF